MVSIWRVSSIPIVVPATTVTTYMHILVHIDVDVIIIDIDIIVASAWAIIGFVDIAIIVASTRAIVGFVDITTIVASIGAIVGFVDITTIVAPLTWISRPNVMAWSRTWICAWPCAGFRRGCCPIGASTIVSCLWTSIRFSSSSIYG